MRSASPRASRGARQRGRSEGSAPTSTGAARTAVRATGPSRASATSRTAWRLPRGAPGPHERQPGQARALRGDDDLGAAPIRPEAPRGMRAEAHAMAPRRRRFRDARRGRPFTVEDERRRREAHGGPRARATEREQQPRPLAGHRGVAGGVGQAFERVLEQQRQRVQARARWRRVEVEVHGAFAAGRHAVPQAGHAPLPEELARHLERGRGAVAAVRHHDPHLEARGNGDARSRHVEEWPGHARPGPRPGGPGRGPENAKGAGQT